MGKNSSAHGPLPLTQPELKKPEQAPSTPRPSAPLPSLARPAPTERTFCGSPVQSAPVPLAPAVTDCMAAVGTSSPPTQEPRGLGVIPANLTPVQRDAAALTWGDRQTACRA